MRICILTSNFPRFPGDNRAPFILSAAQALKQAGIEVRVIAMHIPGTKTYEIWDGIEVIRPRYLPDRWEILQKEGGGLPIIWKKNKLSRLAILPYALVIMIALIKNSTDCDLIHANWTLAGMISWVSSFLHHLPFVVTVHGSDIYEGGRIGPVKFLTRMALSNSDRIIAVSHSLANVTAAMGVRKKIEVIPDGIEVNRFFPSDGKREDLILYVGSFIDRKGVMFLLEAMPDILSDFPNLKLLLVGDGPLRESYEKLIVFLHLEQNVTIMGWQDQNVVSLLMRQAKVFVLPSLNEGLGVVLLEAIASGTPCAGSNIDGIPDIITPEVGVLFEPGDPAAVSRAIKSILSTSGCYDQMCAAARQRAVNVFDWGVVARRLIEVYNKVIDERSNGK
jgi:glycosyltransferase involved in cell wall biosynthesis